MPVCKNRQHCNQKTPSGVFCSASFLRKGLVLQKTSQRLRDALSRARASPRINNPYGNHSRKRSAFSLFPGKESMNAISIASGTVTGGRRALRRVLLGTRLCDPYAFIGLIDATEVSPAGACTSETWCTVSGHSVPASIEVTRVAREVQP